MRYRWDIVPQPARRAHAAAVVPEDLESPCRWHADCTRSCRRVAQTPSQADEDRATEVVVCELSYCALVEGGGRSLQTFELVSKPTSVDQMASGDVDGDGVDDLVMSSNFGTLVYFGEPAQ
jgi:hypothetical protein